MAALANWRMARIGAGRGVKLAHPAQGHGQRAPHLQITLNMNIGKKFTHTLCTHLAHQNNPRALRAQNRLSTPISVRSLPLFPPEHPTLFDCLPAIPTTVAPRRVQNAFRQEHLLERLNIHPHIRNPVSKKCQATAAMNS